MLKNALVCRKHVPRDELYLVLVLVLPTNGLDEIRKPSRPDQPPEVVVVAEQVLFDERLVAVCGNEAKLRPNNELLGSPCARQNANGDISESGTQTQTIA